MDIALTEKAIHEVKRAIEKEGLPLETTYLRAGVSGGGCGSSFSV